MPILGWERGDMAWMGITYYFRVVGAQGEQYKKFKKHIL
jgi:hypothetical protein